MNDEWLNRRAGEVQAKHRGIPEALVERAAIVKWIALYGDEINRVISRSKDGPLKTSMMGEFSATVSIRQAIERGDHLADKPS